MSDIPYSTSETPLKRCKKCGKQYPATREFFRKHRDFKDGLNSRCKFCVKEQNAEYYQRENKKPTRRTIVDGKIQCPTCKEWKPATVEYFPASKERPDGIRTICRPCHDSQKISRARRLGVKPKSIHRDGLKRCCVCKEWKPEDNAHFGFDKNRLGGFSLTCKACVSRLYSINRETHLKRNRAYAAKPENKERMRQLERANPERARVRSHRRRAKARSLPHRFTTSDWARALDYFDHKCAVCGRPRGLWHTLAMDHWIPLTDPRPDNPGTVASNIIPLCHSQKGGMDSCNNSKHKADPVEWLNRIYGKRKAAQILKRINAYFEWIKEQDGGD